jgi:hypothetical protein
LGRCCSGRGLGLGSSVGAMPGHRNFCQAH